MADILSRVQCFDLLCRQYTQHPPFFSTVYAGRPLTVHRHGLLEPEVKRAPTTPALSADVVSD
ncbi:MAG: hypothetical protein AAGI01_14210, partial [Myxococcota bacterium]